MSRRVPTRPADPTSTSPAWGQVPPPVAKPFRVPLVVPFLLAVVPLYFQFERIYYGRGRELAVAIVAAGVLAALRVHRRLLVPAVVLGSVALVPWFGLSLAAHVAPLLLVPLVLWAFGLDVIEKEGGRLPSGERLYASLVFLVPAAISLYRFTAFRFAMLCLVAAVGMAAVSTFVDQPSRLVATAVHRVGQLLAPVREVLRAAGEVMGRIIGVAVMIPAAVVVTVVWVGQRLVRYDPLRPGPSRATSTWVPRAPADPLPGALFSGAPALERPGAKRALQRGGAALISFVLVAIALAPTWVDKVPLPALRDRVGSTLGLAKGCGAFSADQAMDQDPGWPETACEIERFEHEGRFDATTVYRMADYKGEYVNVIHGVRRTWRAPKCSCRRIRMWMFGGSAAFGWWQRDEFTIASELAKLAWKDGIALDIQLRAMPGWVAGQEVRKFAELTVTDEAPDLALFYDGGNDLNRQRSRNAAHRGADESETSFAEDEIDKLLRTGPFPWTPQSFKATPPEEPDPILSDRAVAGHAMNRYLADLELARRIAAAADIEPIFVFQALSTASPLKLSNRDSLPPEDRRAWRKMLELVRTRLPDDVWDLSEALAGAPRVVFKDIFHTNELGSRIVARTLYPRLKEQLLSLRGAPR